MIGRRSTIGLALLCAFAFCAFTAQSAMAQTGEPAINTTAVTCVFEGGKEDFEDAHCDEKVDPGTGDYGHEPISNDEETEIEVTTEKTKDKITTVEGKEVVHPTADSTTSELHATIAGVTTKITCTKVASAPGESYLENTLSGSEHKVTGTVRVNFTGCTVDNPAKCVVKEPIVTTAHAEGVEELESPGGGKEEMGVEYVGEGSEETFAELLFENKGAEKCSLLNGGKAFKVKGSVISTSNVTPSKANKHTGATAVYTPLPKNPATAEEKAVGMQTLEIGLKQADFRGTFTTTMAGAGGDPIALTTVT